jgi:hypothetical protein
MYFDLERRVLNCVRRYLDETNNKYFLEHDGWSTTNEIDVIKLYDYILDHTGFNLKIEYECVRM